MKASVVVAASLVVHGVLALTVGSIGPKKVSRAATAITVREQKKKEKAKEPPPAPVEPPKAPDAKAEPRRPAKAKAAPAELKPTAEPPKGHAASAAMDALPDFGLSLSGGVGPGGLAIPTGGGGEPRASATKPAVHEEKPAAQKVSDGCSEPVVKAKPRSVPQPAYTQAARDASVEGKLRVEVTVDAAGAVTSARVLAGLGHGLDEAALAAARSASFEPATRCGQPVASTFVIAMRFSL